MSTYCEIDGHLHLVTDIPDEYETEVAPRSDESAMLLKVVNRAISCLAFAKRDIEGLAVSRLISDTLAAQQAVALRDVSCAADLACKLLPYADLHVAPGLPAADASFNLSARILPSPIT
jgi:hypothetical protein